MDQKQRKQYLIEPGFQAQFIFKFCLVIMGVSTLIGASVLFITRNSTTVAIENTQVVVKETADFILPSLTLTILLVSAFSAFAVIILTLFVSHKISGPIFRLQREIEKMQDGDLVRNFNIREKDQLQSLAKTLDFVVGNLRDKHTLLRDSCQAVGNYLEGRDFSVSSEEKAELKRLMQEMQDALNCFIV